MSIRSRRARPLGRAEALFPAGGERDYLPLTAEVLAAHLTGNAHIGLYPLLDGDRCWWLAADFDGPDAMIDAPMYLKAARAIRVPVTLEVSRSGVGAHAWMFFTSPVPAETAVWTRGCCGRRWRCAAG